MDKSEKESESMEIEGVSMVRERVSITLPKELLEWIDKKVEARIYANRSHAIEVLILEAMKREKKE
ncbi:MAG: ribbon-helix-helix domain-containing protein [Candidatus Aenigmatarchaeota archaeon]